MRKVAAVLGSLGFALCALPLAAAAQGASLEAAARPKIALVLSGGGARGGAHIGVLRVLEEQRVPIDIVVGTSIGSIVGAAYATGMPLADIEREMRSLSTATLFRDTVRAEVPMHRKADDAVNYIGPEVGIGPDGIELPKGAVAGVALEAVLRRLTARQASADFDELPIRFRAVATDVTSAEIVVLSKGSLATAVRASMAIPAAVSPVEIDGRLLVDGGVMRNLPVDVARQMGAQVVIAVNIGTPLRKRDEIASLASVSDQMSRMMMAQNVRRSIAELGDGDVLIAPDLGDITTASFDRLGEAADAGEAAALEALRATLARQRQRTAGRDGACSRIRMAGCARRDVEVQRRHFPGSGVRLLVAGQVRQGHGAGRELGAFEVMGDLGVRYRAQELVALPVLLQYLRLVADLGQRMLAAAGMEVVRRGGRAQVRQVEEQRASLVAGSGTGRGLVIVAAAAAGEQGRRAERCAREGDAFDELAAHQARLRGGCRGPALQHTKQRAVLRVAAFRQRLADARAGRLAIAHACLSSTRPASDRRRITS